MFILTFLNVKLLFRPPILLFLSFPKQINESPKARLFRIFNVYFQNKFGFTNSLVWVIEQETQEQKLKVSNYRVFLMVVELLSVVVKISQKHKKDQVEKKSNLKQRPQKPFFTRHVSCRDHDCVAVRYSNLIPQNQSFISDHSKKPL